MYHLYGSLDINLTVEAECPDLVNDHVDDDEGPRPPDASRAVDNDGTSRVWRETKVKNKRPANLSDSPKDSCFRLTSWRKFKTLPGSSGVPWSGHPRKWK